MRLQGVPLIVSLILVYSQQCGAIPIVDAKKYLIKFGYLEPSSTSDATAVELAVAEFQNEVGLNSDGSLNKDTLAVMKQPRCGNKDWEGGKRRRKRFVPTEQKWPHSVLTWRVEDPHKILKSYDLYVVRNALNRAFDKWASASKYGLRFQQLAPDVPFPADITVFFASGFHNDTLPFDGSNGVVAHGFYPTNGNLHFDADERWTLNMDNGINLYQTAVHEIGHLLGLQHSTDDRAVMFPINRPYDPAYTLADDDVRDMQRYLQHWHGIAQANDKLIRRAKA